VSGGIRVSVHVFGIRHHGVGSARSLTAALEALQPDCILIEGPPDADALLPLAADEAMEPPVALLIYNPEEPKHATWYPFAVYSPEWIALRFGLASGAEVRFMDLPQKYMMALEPDGEDAEEIVDGTDVDEAAEEQALVIDPLQTLAEIAGEGDGERWWGRVVEEVENPSDIFALITDAMTALRADTHPSQSYLARREELREAWMRKTIHAVEKKFARIAVVCGAWHTPALNKRDQTSADNALLKGLASVKTVATFVPWTYSRLSFATGYGAGILSPGWYHHLWETPRAEVTSRWLVKVAALLRHEGLLASSAQVIDALRLSETLADLRGRTVGLDELNESSVAVMCAGRTEPMALIHRKLIVSERMGKVPADVPMVPLQRDLLTLQKKLRLKVSPDTITLDLDLRQPTDLARSQLFHRLNLFDIGWAKLTRGQIRTQGTFHEFWEVGWSPELDIRLIEANVWGNTIESAATAYTANAATEAHSLRELTPLLKAATLAALPEVLTVVLARLNDVASVSHDVSDLMQAVPPLVDTLRYGDVRQTDSALIEPVLESMVLRICIGLFSAALHLDDEAAGELNTQLVAVHSALQLAQRPALLERWYEALTGLMTTDGPHALLMGTATRLLFRADRITAINASDSMRRAVSVGSTPQEAANWLEGFLTGMENVLLRNELIFNLVDQWVTNLSEEQFKTILPLLRRTFSTYNSPARRNIAERVKRGTYYPEPELIDEERAALVLPIMRQILGLPQ
jgi:hypothetical protein